MRPRIFINCSGGGTRGALFTYILEQLNRTRDVVGMSAISVGALIAYAVCTGNTEALRDLWLGIRRQQDFMKGNWPLDGAYTLNPMKRLMEDQGWGLPFLKMYVGVFYFGKGKLRIVKCNDRPLEEVIKLAIASSSISGIHDNIRIDKVNVGDGGHASGLPTPLPRGWKKWDLDEVHIPISQPLDPELPVLAEDEVNGTFERLARFGEFQGHRALLQSIRYFKRLARENPSIAFYLYPTRSWSDSGPVFTKDDDLLRAAIRRRLAHGEWMWANRIRLGPAGGAVG